MDAPGDWLGAVFGPRREGGSGLCPAVVPSPCCSSGKGTRRTGPVLVLEPLPELEPDPLVGYIVREWMTARPARPAPHTGGPVSTTNQPEIQMTVTPVAGAEVRKFMTQEGVDPAVGGLRVSVQPGGCSGFKYGLLIEDAAAEDDLIVDQGDYRVFVDPFSAQYIGGVVIDYTSSMQGSGFTFKNPNATGGCGCGSSFSA